jgi:ribosomal protein S12 methylthiotransferase
VHAHLPQPHDPFTSLVPPQGIKLTPQHFAYLKISEGCNHSCTFCIIPSMRGPLVSRPIGDVLQEARHLADAGVRELLVISQDTSAYGVDVKYRTGFAGGSSAAHPAARTLRALGELGIWVRLHYVYPYPSVDALVPLMAEGPDTALSRRPFPARQCPRILKAMKRPASAENNLERLRHGGRFVPRSRCAAPSLPVFLVRPKPSSRNCWRSSPRRAWIASAALPIRRLTARRPMPCRTRCRRKFARSGSGVMELQEDISAELLAAKIGREIEVLVDEVDEEGTIARSAADAPEIDGLVFVNDHFDAEPGDFLRVRVVDADEHDLYAEVAAGLPERPPYSWLSENSDSRSAGGRAGKKDRRGAWPPDGRPAFALYLSEDAEQAGTEQFAALLLDQPGVHDDIGQPGFIFEGDKNNAAGGARPLAAGDDSGGAQRAGGRLRSAAGWRKRSAAR